MPSAARELARSVAAAVSPEAVRLSVSNRSSLSAADIGALERLFAAQAKTAEQSGTEVRITISENLTDFVAVAEIRGKNEPQVLIESWPRPTAPVASQESRRRMLTIERKLMWEQDAPILDAVETGDMTLVLDRERVLLVRNGAEQSAPIGRAQPWPRDPRGHLTVSGTAFTAYLPGMICRGSTLPQLSVECRNSTAPWLLAPGVLARFTPDRNYFDGHLDLAPGGPHEGPSFYTASPAGDGWILAETDGHARKYTASFQFEREIGSWGSDIAGIATACGPRILATRPASPQQPDSLQGFDAAGPAPAAAGAPLEFAGSVTALWSAGNSATVVVRDLQSKHYAAFNLAASCGS